MPTNPFWKNTNTLSKIATLVIFLGLIRSISEPLRLQYHTSTPLPLSAVRMYLIGALAAAIGLLAMTVFSYYGRSKTVIGIGLLTLVCMLIVKQIYFNPS